MAAVRMLYRLVFAGRLFDKESWSMSLHVEGPTSISVNPSVFSVPIQTYFSAAGARISNAARVDEIKFNLINPTNGRYVDQVSKTFAQNDLATGIQPSTIGQATVAVSTRTALTRGRGHAGRFYPPSGAQTISTDGRLTALVAQDAALAAKNLVNAINAAVTAEGGRVVVFSKVGQSVEPVTGVRVGRVVDTIRSRRTSLDEAHESQSLS